MFSTGKNWILNTLGILCMPQIFWHRKGPEYLYRLIDDLPKQTTSEMKVLEVYKFTFNNDFMINRELNFIVTRNDFSHVLICWLVTFL